MKKVILLVFLMIVISGCAMTSRSKGVQSNYISKENKAIDGLVFSFSNEKTYKTKITGFMLEGVDSEFMKVHFTIKVENTNDIPKKYYLGSASLYGKDKEEYGKLSNEADFKKSFSIETIQPGESTTFSASAGFPLDSVIGEEELEIVDVEVKDIGEE